MNPTPEMIEQAAQWAAVLDSGEIGDQERTAYESWCAEHPLHRRTLDRMRAFDERLESGGDIEQGALRRLMKRRKDLQPRLKQIALSVAVLAVAGWASWQSVLGRDDFSDYQTATGQLRTYTLKDGSEVTLDTDAAIGVRFDKAERRVRLIQGQVHASVSRDVSRPFIVETPHGTATALGTAFTVLRDQRDTLITVIEARVRVCPGQADSGDHRCRTLRAGDRARVTVGEVAMLPEVDPQAASTWVSGWLEADEQEVTDVLTELARYRELPIQFKADELRGLKVTGSFPLRDVDRALDGVARIATLQIRRQPSGVIVVERR